MLSSFFLLKKRTHKKIKNKKLQLKKISIYDLSNAKRQLPFVFFTKNKSKHSGSLKKRNNIFFI
jgi:hypothetical protein